MLRKLETILPQKCMIERGARLLVGLSGGPDSLCLLHALYSLGYPLVVAHLDHQLRAESAEEARRARAYAESLKLKFVQQSIDVASFSREHGLSLEEGARQARYQFLFAEARNSSSQAVLVGHTADDQVETVLMHLLRGAGLSGLAGMAYRSLPNAWSQSIPLARPLLGVWREQIWQYLEENGLTPSLDPSNQDVHIYRNRLRHEAIPYLETLNPQFRQHIWQTAQILSGEDEIVQERLCAEWDSVVLQQSQSAIVIDARAIEKLPLGIQRRILKKAIQYLRPEVREMDFQAIERAVEIVHSAGLTARTDLVAGLRLQRTPGQIWLFDLQSGIKQQHWPEIPATRVQDLNIPGELSLGGSWLFSSRILNGQPEIQSEIHLNKDPFQTWLDLDKLQIPLLVRARQPGERFQPLGMPAGSTKVSDFMINERLPEPARRNWPLVLSGESIAWIPGYRPAHPFRITEQTTRVAHLQLLRIDKS